MSADPHPEPIRLFGWKDISAALDVSDRHARDLASRNRDPLPVEVGHKGVWAYATALRDWMRRQNVPSVVHRALAAERGAPEASSD